MSDLDQAARKTTISAANLRLQADVKRLTQRVDRLERDLQALQFAANVDRNIVASTIETRLDEITKLVTLVKTIIEKGA